MSEDQLVIRLKKRGLIVGGIIILLIILGVWAGIILTNREQKSAPQEPVLKIEYCGAEPSKLCVLSFGRDIVGNMLINFYVPDPDLPDFYIRIARRSGERDYLCHKIEEVPTSVYCLGDPIPLGESIEISVLSNADDHLMAKGNLVLMAVLLSTPAAIPATSEGQATPTATFASQETRESRPTAPPTATSDSSPDSSYPSYPNSQ